MPYCSRCGTSIEERANYCPYCGIPVEKPATPGGHGSQVRQSKNGQGTMVTELWSKEGKSTGISSVEWANMQFVEWASDAQKIVLAGWNKFHIVSHDGVKEISIKTDTNKPIYSMAVTADCSRIFFWINRRGFNLKDITAYNQDGTVELEIEPCGKKEERTVAVSSDGRLIGAKSSEYFEAWDAQGNLLLRVFSNRDRYYSALLGGLTADISSFAVAPNSSFIALVSRGSFDDANLVALYRVPDIDNLLRIADLEQRMNAWKFEVFPLDPRSEGYDRNVTGAKWKDSNVCAANNRFVLWKGNSVCVFEVMEDKCSKILTKNIAGSSTLEWVGLVPNGRYLYFLSNGTLNLFDIEKGTVSKNLYKFPDGTSVLLAVSDDGSKVFAIIQNLKLFGRTVTMNMLSVQLLD